MNSVIWKTVAVGVALLISVPAHAQPVFGSAESLECMVANADLVVVGKVVEFDAGEKADDRGARPVTIAVEETLKGEHRDRLRVRLAHPVSALADWRVRSSRLLVARGVAPIATRVIDLVDSELAVFRANFTLLRKPEPVIRIAKEAVRRLPGVKQIDTFGLVVPAEAVAGTKWAKYHATTLLVPVDERLEQRAHESIRSKDYSKREEGARALRYFKSDENIARVKALLDDPGWAYLWRAEENDGVEVRIHGVRREAYETLKYWGVNVERPTIRVEIFHNQITRAKSGGSVRE